MVWCALCGGEGAHPLRSTRAIGGRVQFYIYILYSYVYCVKTARTELISRAICFFFGFILIEEGDDISRDLTRVWWIGDPVD